MNLAYVLIMYVVAVLFLYTTERECSSGDWIVGLP